ncbi:hypothetical protein SSS_09674 [Sarcoptes scabiei]|uniref:Uncharacterized protein n=1 Tax=Sarcoptes scabiei TaxID=52283 RepID=A0A834VFY8_SARSC|nr:hypothetical protein SSS_09674 [Sarcoptes scabiei]
MQVKQQIRFTDRLCSFLFGLYKFVYAFFTMLVLLVHIDYVYENIKKLDEAKSLFNQNRFAYFMGMFLGFLFRLSGFLSACKEKIALTFTYSLFLILILLILRQFDFVFLLHAITAALAILFVLMLKYSRYKQRNRLLRHQVASSSNDSNRMRINSSSTHRRPQSLNTNVLPTAPPIEHSQMLSSSSNTVEMNSWLDPSIQIGNSFKLTHTPPPSYKELFQSH